MQAQPFRAAPVLSLPSYCASQEPARTFDVQPQVPLALVPPLSASADVSPHEPSFPAPSSPVTRNQSMRLGSPDGSGTLVQVYCPVTPSEQTPSATCQVARPLP